MEDFRQVLLQSKNKYHAAPHSKAHKWLGVLASKVTHWNSVLDVLSQGGQQYGSLVWGSMKFLLVVSRRTMISLRRALTLC
jgi:hypothetical protein